jgi:hypothetical protein
MKVPKRLSVDQIREMCGNKIAEQVVTAYLRAKAQRVLPITVGDLVEAQQYVTGESISAVARRNGVTRRK